MKTYSTFAVLFYINRKKTKKNGLTPLMGRVSINTEIAQFSAKIDIDPLYWNAKTYRMNGRSNHAAEVNQHIENLTTKINSFHKEILDEQGYITAELVKNALNGIGVQKKNLLELFNEHNIECEKQQGVTKAKKYTAVYKAVYKQLELYMKKYYDMEDIPLRQLDLKFIENFDTFLRIEQRYTANTIFYYTALLQKIVRLAINKGILFKQPFSAYTPKHDICKRKHMTQEELDKFMQTTVPSKAQCHTRDMFIFSTFTGLAYADLYNLSEQNIHKEKDGTFWISNKRQKTGVECNIRLLDIPLQIIEKYKNERVSDKLFIIKTLPAIQDSLNRFAKKCGIEKRITFHMARHNFATLITLSQGVALETVCQMMGHKNIKTTQIYAKLTQQKVNEDMKLLKKRIGKKYTMTQTQLSTHKINKLVINQ